MSLTLYGKKNKIKKKDFDMLAKSLSLTEKQKQNSYQSFLKKTDNAIWWIENSFLPKNQIEKMQQVLYTRKKLLNK